MLSLAKNRSEVRAILSEGNVLVDGKIQTEELFPTGLMDVISIPTVSKQYRVLPSEKGLALQPINKNEAEFKLCRIEDKTILNGGNVQLNLHDGRNIRIQVKEANKPEEDIFGTSDTVKISLPQQEIMEHFKFSEGASAVIISGKNIGKHGRIVAVEHREVQKRKKALVTVEDAKGTRFQTTVEYVFVVGDARPHITLLEAA